MLSKDIINTINLDARDENGNTILQQAVLENNAEIVALVLRKLEKADNKDSILNAQNNNGDTSFFLAIRNKQYLIAQMLDFAGADKSIKNNDGQYVINTEEQESENNNVIIEDSEIVDFKFPVVKCSNNPEDVDDIIGNQTINPHDITEILFAIGNINPVKNYVTESNNETLTENNEVDPFLNILTDQYLILKNLKQSGGYNKQFKQENKIISGSRKI
jgi:hypothetical protein